MLFRELWNLLHAAAAALQGDSPLRQDDAVNTLFYFLDTHKAQYYPSVLYAQSLWVLHQYLDEALPALGYSTEDSETVAADYLELINTLKIAQAEVMDIEQTLVLLLDQMRTCANPQILPVAETVLRIAQVSFGLPGQTPASLTTLQDELALLREHFTFTHMSAFWQSLLTALFDDLQSTGGISFAVLLAANLRKLIENVLEAYFQAKSVLVDNFRQGYVLPVQIVVDVETQSEHVAFWQQRADLTMQASADIARRVAVRFLREACGRNVPDQLTVYCAFPERAAQFKDTSASLLIAIAIVGAVLGVHSHPATVVTGALGADGAVLEVGFINEKVAARPSHESPLLNGREGVGGELVQRRVERFILPEANLAGLAGAAQADPGLRLIPVRTFAEAVWHVLDHHAEDWGNAPAIAQFYGRREESTALQCWILDERCRFIATLGMGGIGKTTLIRALAEQIKHRFQYVFWRDVRNAPPLRDLLWECITFLSDQQPLRPSASIPQQISLLLEYVRRYRCLLILDNLETLLQSGAGAGNFLAGYEEYALLLRQLATTDHQSCLLITSREKPAELSAWEGDAVRSLTLKGLRTDDALAFLRLPSPDLGEGVGGEVAIIDHYAGHPLALKLIAATIRDVFHGDIAVFCQTASPLFFTIEALLDQQYARVTKPEQDVLLWLAIAREPLSVAELKNLLLSSRARRQLAHTLEILHQKSLVEIGAAGVALQPVVMDYLTHTLVKQIGQELACCEMNLFNSHALLLAQAKEYLRDSQKRLILTPLTEYLYEEHDYDKVQLEAALREMLQRLRAEQPLKPGYAAGNSLNLLAFLRSDLNGWNFSQVEIRQAYLPEVNVQHVNCTGTHWVAPVFTETFGNVLSVAFSPDGSYLAAGTISNEIRVWEAATGNQVWSGRGHRGWVWSVAFSPDGQRLVSSSQDHTIRLWDMSSGQCLRVLAGHTDWVWCVAFSPAGDLLVSAGNDDTIRIWDSATGASVGTLTGHTGPVHAVAIHPSGTMLASASADQTIRLWELSTHATITRATVHALRCSAILTGHADRVRTVAFHPNGQWLASGSDDDTVRLWDLATAQCTAVLRGHAQSIKSVAFHPDGALLASGSDDSTVRLWNVQTGHGVKTLPGHRSWVWSVAFSPDGQRLVSGGSDQSIRVWDAHNGQCLRTMRGYTIRATSAAFSPDGQWLACGYSDDAARIWDVTRRQCRTSLRGHRNWIMAVGFSPDSRWLLTASSDATLRVWDAATGQCRRVLTGHGDQVRALGLCSAHTVISGGYDRSVRRWDVDSGQGSELDVCHADWILALTCHPTLPLFASGSEDHRVRLWNNETGQLVHALEGHTAAVWSVAFAPDGRLLASGSVDQTLRLWDVSTGNGLNVLHGHTNQIRSVAFHPDGCLLVSGSQDQTIRVWDITAGTCLVTLPNTRQSWIWSVAFHPEGHLLASAHEDGTLELWDTTTWTSVAVLAPERPYEGLNRSGATGLSAGQQELLRTLGATLDF